MTIASVGPFRPTHTLLKDANVTSGSLTIGQDAASRYLELQVNGDFTAAEDLRVDRGSRLIVDGLTSFSQNLSSGIIGNLVSVSSGPEMNLNNLELGRDGQVSLVVGGVLTAENVTLGEGSASNPNNIGRVDLVGAQAVMEMNFVQVGKVGTGRFRARSGATATSDYLEIGSQEFLFGDGTTSQSEGFVGVDDAVWNTRALVVASDGVGSLEISGGGQVNASGGIVIAGGASSIGRVEVSESGSMLTSDSGLEVGEEGDARLTINDGGLVRVSGELLIGERGEILIDGGRLEFDAIELETFNRIDGPRGSVAASIENTAYANASSLTGLQGSSLDLTDVVLENSGVLHGSAALGTSLINESSGEVQTFTGEQMRFGGSGVNQADAEINNFGGLVRFEGSLTNDAGGFIGGRGVFIANGGIQNSGVMAFTGTTDVLGDVEMMAGSQMVTSGFATTTLFDDVVFNDTPGNRAEIRTSEGSATVILGGISGDMNFTGTVFAEGDLRPGNSPGVGVFEGDFLLGDTAATFIELGGIDSGEFDQFDIAGDFGLGGSLDVSLIGGFSLGFGQEFLVADVEGSMTGMFSGLNEGSLVGNYGGQDLFITYNGFGGNRGVGLFTAVPEPSSGCVLLLCACALAGRRKRQR